MTVKTTRFDMADYLDSEETIQEYFRQVMDDGDPDEIIRALEHIAKVHGMTQLAKALDLAWKTSTRHLPKVPNHVSIQYPRMTWK